VLGWFLDWTGLVAGLVCDEASARGWAGGCEIAWGWVLVCMLG
jgi:hypothetical protein